MYPFSPFRVRGSPKEDNKTSFPVFFSYRGFPYGQAGVVVDPSHRPPAPPSPYSFFMTTSLHDLQGEGSTPTEIARNLQSSWSLQDLEVWKSKLNIKGEQEHPLKKNKFQLLLCFFGTPSFTTSSSMYFYVVQWSLWWRQCVIALAGEPSPQWEAGVVSQWPGYDDVNGQDAIIPKSGYGQARTVHPLNREAIPKKMGL